jgi:hypothetical protein
VISWINSFGAIILNQQISGKKQPVLPQLPSGRAAKGGAGTLDDAGELESGPAVEVATPPRSPCNHKLFLG